jgi:hypothetical protein
LVSNTSSEHKSGPLSQKKLPFSDGSPKISPDIAVSPSFSTSGTGSVMKPLPSSNIGVYSGAGAVEQRGKSSESGFVSAHNQIAGESPAGKS